MSSNLGFNNSNWIDEAITKKLIKYYNFEHFHNMEEIGYGGFGKVYRANWKNSHKYLALKSFFNFNDITVKAIVHEVLNYNVKHFPFIIIILFRFLI
jgi:serine/threonine protein kinase